MKTISFLVTVERGEQLIAYFEKNYSTMCEINLHKETITINFIELYENLVHQGLFHAGLSIGLSTALKTLNENNLSR